MKVNSIHKDFRLNGFSFPNEEKLVAYSKSLSKEVHYFLIDWFSSNTTTVTVTTSGSTGIPKPIALDKNHMINSAIATGKYFSLKSKTKALLCLPVNFIAGKMMLVRAMTLGWCLDIVEASSAPLTEVNKYYDFAAMVPLQVKNSLKKLNLIKVVIIGGGVVSSKLQQKLQKLTTTAFATYGMTETITHIAVKKLTHATTLNTSYEVLPNVKIAIDERNCLVIEATDISDKIIFTNDVVQLTSVTTFDWLGRFDHIINSGGIKLQPEIIEKKLKPYVKQRFFIAGIPDERLGEKVVLIIEKTTGEFSEDSIQCLNKYEQPKEVYYLPRFIETTSKKIHRKKTLSLIFDH